MNEDNRCQSMVYKKNSPGELSALVSLKCRNIARLCLAWQLNTCAYNWRCVMELSYHKLNVLPKCSKVATRSECPNKS